VICSRFCLRRWGWNSNCKAGATARPGRPQGIAPTIRRASQVGAPCIVGAIPCGRPFLAYLVSYNYFYSPVDRTMVRRANRLKLVLLGKTIYRSISKGECLCIAFEKSL